MTQEQAQLAVHYWKQSLHKNPPSKYQRYCKFWDVSKNYDRVLEIGTGPLGGVLPYIQADVKVGLDPLYHVFERNSLLHRFPDIQYVTGDIANPPFNEPFTAVFSANCLDHGKSRDCYIDNIASLIVSGGWFYLHVHLREGWQLNAQHTVPVNTDALFQGLERNGFLLPGSLSSYGIDPIAVEPYKTLIGVWQKR